MTFLDCYTHLKSLHTLKIVACQLNLKVWDKRSFGHVRNSLKKKLKELQEAEEGGNYRTNLRRIYMLREEIQRLKNREECMWKQRSRNAWLKEGDSNSWFFHCRANQRNRRNFIVGLEDSDGVWRDDEGRMGGIIEQYFGDIYTTSNPSGFEDILNGIHPAINEEDVGLLGRDFHANEVRRALD